MSARRTMPQPQESGDEMATKQATEKTQLPFSHDAGARGRARAKAVAAERLAAGLSARPSPIERALENPGNYRLAVYGKCWDCVCGDNGDPCPSYRIGTCDITACPLWKLRPYQKYVGTPVPKALRDQFDTPAPLECDEPVRAAAGRRK